MSVGAISINEARRILVKQKFSRRWLNMVLSPAEVGALAPEWGPQRSEVWANHIYVANVWRDAEKALIGIFSLDGEARHDWRDFQRIKNDVVGEEWEAVELYPAESRLIDPSNYFYLWARPSFADIGRKIGRQIITANLALAPQRPWHPLEEPKMEVQIR